MFTVKFCTYFDDGTHTATSISCPHYSVYKRENGSFAVTTYKTMTTIDSVERTVMSDHLAKMTEKEESEARCMDPANLPPYFHCCYVENQSGKTIDKIN